MELLEKVNLMQMRLRELEYIKKRRRKKEIDDIDAYNMISKIIDSDKEELISLTLFDIFEYAKEYYLLRIQ